MKKVIPILNSQDTIIRRYFPNYNRQKSEIIWEAGSDTQNGFIGSFRVHIYRKGSYRFDVDNNFDRINIKYSRV